MYTTITLESIDVTLNHLILAWLKSFGYYSYSRVQFCLVDLKFKKLLQNCIVQFIYEYPFSLPVPASSNIT